MAPATFGNKGLDRPHLLRVGALLTRILSLRARILGSNADAQLPVGGTGSTCNHHGPKSGR